MTTSKERLTVILPVHNGEPYIAAAIRTVLNQTFKEFDLWILENGSNDQTVQSVKSFKDPRITLFELGSVGVQGALQYALENARTEWLARMDADDLMLPRRLETQMHFVEQHPQLTFVGTAYAMLTPFGHIVERKLTAGTRIVSQELLAHNRRFFGDPTIIFNRRAALNAGGADLDFPKVDGVPLLFRLLTQGVGWEIADQLHVYRVRPGSLSRSREHLVQAFQVRRKYAPELIDTQPQSQPQSIWRFIANLEILTGDKRSIDLALARMKEEGPFSDDADEFRARNLGKLRGIYYKWRCGSIYKHRPDLESLFAADLTREP